MLWYSLGPDLRRRYRKQATRTRGFYVQREIRAAVRSTMSYLRNWLAEDVVQIKVLPISSGNWLSEVRRINKISTVIFDAEQTNAQLFLLARKLAMEAPIFHYVEFMIRIGELLASLGKDIEAIRVAQLCQLRLEQFSERSGNYGEFPRLQDPEGLETFQRIGAAPAVALVLGHEIGHALVQQAAGPQADFEIIAREWRRLNEELWLIPPDYFQRLDTNGRPCDGFFSSIAGVMQIPELEQSVTITLSVIDESKADFVGFVVFTHFVAENGISPDESIDLLFSLFLAAERLSVVQRLIPQIPNHPMRKAIHFRFPLLPSRFVMLATIIKLVSEGALRPPDDVATYWKRCSHQSIQDISTMGNLKRIALIAENPGSAARGGLYLGTGAPFPPRRPGLNFLGARYGPSAGNMLWEYLPFAKGEYMYELSNLDDEEDPAIQGNSGFACAIRDSTRAIMLGDTIDEMCGTSILTAWKARKVQLWDAIRSPRLLVMDRSLSSKI
jgi:hypothetical protein